jgi:hypothetical protein
MEGKMNSVLEPGMIVRHPQCPDWGLGQVQSRVGDRITVNFEHRGKVVVNGQVIGLEVIWDVKGQD